MFKECKHDVNIRRKIIGIYSIGLVNIGNTLKLFLNKV